MGVKNGGVVGAAAIQKGDNRSPQRGKNRSPLPQNPRGLSNLDRMGGEGRRKNRVYGRNRRYRSERGGKSREEHSLTSLGNNGPEERKKGSSVSLYTNHSAKKGKRGKKEPLTGERHDPAYK